MRERAILDVVEKHKEKHGRLISILGDIQGKYGWLSPEALRIVADATGCSLVDVYGVATFYGSFSLEPRGKHLISVCRGTACHVLGAQVIAEEFERQLGVKAGGKTSDGDFTLNTVHCLGACAIGPIVVVDGHYFSNVTVGKVSRILKQAREGLDKVEAKADQRTFPVEVSCPHCNRTLMDPKHLIDSYPSIRVMMSFADKHGWVGLSSLYGSYNVESEYEIPTDIVVNFFCPHCHAELVGAAECGECGAPMVPMIVRGNGVVQICSRRGCKGHMLDLSSGEL